MKLTQRTVDTSIFPKARAKRLFLMKTCPALVFACERVASAAGFTNSKQAISTGA